MSAHRKLERLCTQAATFSATRRACRLDEHVAARAQSCIWHPRRRCARACARSAQRASCAFAATVITECGKRVSLRGDEPTRVHVAAATTPATAAYWIRSSGYARARARTPIEAITRRALGNYVACGQRSSPCADGACPRRYGCLRCNHETNVAYARPTAHRPQHKPKLAAHAPRTRDKLICAVMWHIQRCNLRPRFAAPPPTSSVPTAHLASVTALVYTHTHTHVHSSCCMPLRCTNHTRTIITSTLHSTSE